MLSERAPKGSILQVATKNGELAYSAANE
jgi:hypothetical protein